MFELVYIHNGEEITKQVNVVDIQSYFTLHKAEQIKIKSLTLEGKSVDFESIINNLKL